MSLAVCALSESAACALSESAVCALSESAACALSESAVCALSESAVCVLSESVISINVRSADTGAVAVSAPGRIETSFDVADFVLKALDAHSASLACVLNLSAHISPDALRRLQRGREDL
jgi:hypothetical protein